jgi:excisionase family DNA binding protein
VSATIERLVTAREAAEQLRISLPQIYELARHGILPAVRIGRGLRFSPQRLAEFVSAGGKGWEGGWRKGQG